MDECICKGNWRSIVSECENQIGKQFRDHRGDVATFFGVVHSNDDYYYGMIYDSAKLRRLGDATPLRLLSCVGSLETHGYRLVEEEHGNLSL